MPKYHVWAYYDKVIEAKTEFEVEQDALEDIESYYLRVRRLDEEESE